MKKFTTQNFIDKATHTHGYKYNYSKTKYINSKTNVVITCKHHGDFTQLAGHHMYGQGCPKCSDEISGGKRRVATENFIVRANIIHDNNYKYSILNINENPLSQDIITITCPIHGEFTQKRYKHLDGKGCKKCGYIRAARKTSSTTDNFINKAKEVHKNKYNYSKVEYKNNRIQIIIGCKQHGDFSQTPHNHLTGSGCPECSLTGFKPTQKAILYYISINNGQYYKIGVTNASTNVRFMRDTRKVKEVKTWEYDVGFKALEAEKKILKRFDYARYKGDEKPLYTGNTEMFTHDVLLLDT